MYRIGKKVLSKEVKAGKDSRFFEYVNRALSDIEARYDVNDKQSFSMAMEGTSNIAHLYKTLLFMQKGDALEKMVLEPMDMTDLLHYSGNSSAIQKLVGEYGGYFQDVMQKKSGEELDVSEMEYFMQLRVKRLQNMGIDPSIIIHPHV